MTDQKIKLIIEAINRTDAAFNGLKRQLKDSQAGTDTLNAKSQDLTSSIKRLAASVSIFTTALFAIKSGITYLATIETAALGIAAAFMTGGKYIDATSGKALAAQDALNAAQGDSRKIIEELQYANLQTIATLDELINAYQVTLPVALAKGFDRQQVKDFTVAMVQAAGAIGLQMNQLAEETRSLLTGAIDPRTSRIATVLGLRNEDINKFKGDAKGLFNFLMGELAAYRTAGSEAQKTWAGLWSNFKDIINQTLGKAFEPLFEALKDELKSVADNIVTIDDKSKKIKWNPEFLEGITAFREGIENLIIEVYRLGMLLDKIGGSFTGVMHEVTFEQLWGGDFFAKKNDEYRKRYMKSEKALMDMILRPQGWKPVTPEFNKKLLTASPEEKKKYQYFQTDVGEEEQFTKQVLRYYRETGAKKDAKWKGNKPSPEDNEKKLNAAIKKTVDEIERLETIQQKRNEAIGESALLANEFYISTFAPAKTSPAYKHQPFNPVDWEEPNLTDKEWLEDYLADVDKLEAKEREKSELIWEQAQTNMISTQEELDARALKYGEFYDGITVGMRQWAKEQDTVAQSAANAMKRMFSGMTDALTDFVMTGKADFKALADSIIRDLVRISIQQSITEPLAKNAGSWITTAVKWISGGGDWSGGGVFTNSTGAFHAGGVPGVDSPSFYRVVPSALFNSAPRFHSGIGPGERPAIIRNDEGVFTPGQMKALGKGAGGSDAGVTNIIIHAADAKSFEDLCRRNPGALTTPIMQALRDNKIRPELKRLVG